MSRVCRNPPASTTRRPPATRPTQQSIPSTSPTNQTITRGARTSIRGPRTSIRGRALHTQRPQQERNDYDPYNENDGTKQEQHTVHVGEGYHMFTPSTTKREQMRRQAENEQRQYEAHVERTRLHDLHEVHRLGGDGLGQDEVRRRQAEKYRREKFERLEKSHQNQFEKKQQEENEIEAKKQAARQQSMQNEKQNRVTQLHSMKPTVNQNDQGATGWTTEAREADRQETMDRFLNRFTRQYNDMNISSDENETKIHNDKSKSEKLSILREMLPQIDDQTLENYLEIYNDNIDAIVSDLAS
ncbi:unnamed protein product [Rotaria sordida]|uniref:CUE domain-containing protein n=1 Tax=Rotaria sordida TaxID=392033 RepID=A0A814X6T4_9BILA|nr:unnamed protein product [Rotaria sordida]